MTYQLKLKQDKSANLQMLSLASAQAPSRGFVKTWLNTKKPNFLTRHLCFALKNRALHWHRHVTTDTASCSSSSLAHLSYFWQIAACMTVLQSIPTPSSQLASVPNSIVLTGLSEDERGWERMRILDKPKLYIVYKTAWKLLYKAMTSRGSGTWWHQPLYAFSVIRSSL